MWPFKKKIDIKDTIIADLLNSLLEQEQRADRYFELLQDRNDEIKALQNQINLLKQVDNTD